MRGLVQRVTRARVTVESAVVGSIDRGLLVMVGVTHDDTPDDAAFLAGKLVNLRIFDDATGALNQSALDIMAGGEAVGVLVVSQFTLYADVRRGRRPSFVRAAPGEVAQPLVSAVIDAVSAFGLSVAQGRFGAEMAVELVNDGPVTIWIDTQDLRA